MSDWWTGKPMRMVQTNLREIDANLDLETYVCNLKEFAAEVVLFNTGGIVANYPTDLPFHFRNPCLKDDLVGKVLARVKREGMRYLARFDFSKVNETLAKANEKWLYMNLAGEPVNYNGQVQTCVNGEYQQELALCILGEVLDRYAVDGVFFNMIGYQTYDYSGNYHGICQCGGCRKRFRDMFGLDLPKAEDRQDPVFRKYERFRAATSAELFWKITKFVKEKRPGTAVCTSTHEGVDIYRKESNTGIERPLPEWTYSASDNVKSVLGSWPGMRIANTAVHFIDFPYRHSGVSPNLTKARLAGDLISGGWIDYYVIGALEGQEDRLCFAGAREVFRFHRDNEKWFTGTSPRSDVCLIAPEGSRLQGSMGEYRGIYRILSEAHLLFDVMHDSTLDDPAVADRLKAYQVVVLPDARNLSGRAAGAVEEYVKAGGKLVATGAPAACDENGDPAGEPGLNCLGASRIESVRPRTPGAYLKVLPADKRRLNGFEDLDIIHLYSEFRECRPGPDAEPLLSLIEPGMFGPPEKCYYTRQTDIPGGLVMRAGAGRSVYLPWSPGAQYAKLAHPSHAMLFGAIFKDLLEFKPSFETDAPPFVEVSMHAEASGRWCWVGLLNHSGQLGTAFHEPAPLRGVRVRVRTGWKVERIRALKSGSDLDFTVGRDEWVEFALPDLGLYEIILFIPAA